MSDRETIHIEVAGHTIVAKTYLTAREMLPLTDIADLSNSQKTALVLNQAIVSLDGSADNISDRLLDLPIAEYTPIVQEVTAIINPTMPQK